VHRVLAFRELLDELRAERVEVARVAGGDQAFVDHDLLVDDDAGLPVLKNACTKRTASSSWRRWSGFVVPPGSTSPS